jgi:hypothetical protein
MIASPPAPGMINGSTRSNPPNFRPDVIAEFVREKPPPPVVKNNYIFGQNTELRHKYGNIEE